jgi:glycosyltransferase involved in cell wall biosynthesis
VVPNYNYGRFLGEAVESAFAQTRRPLETIVVDDGSTDDSRAVIASLGDRVRPLFKENGGQGSAINAGCAMARGDVVFLLDPDDMMEPDAVEAVLGDWPEDAVMTHYRLRLVAEAGRPRRGTTPAHWVPLDSGDLRQKMLETGGFSTTVTSGIALRRDALLQVLPVPEESFRSGADGYLVRAIAFLGPVHAIQRPLGRYRRHSESDTAIGTTPERMAASFRRQIQFAENGFSAVRSLARSHGLVAADDLGGRDPNFLLVRLCSHVADPAQHPVPGDTRMGLLREVVAATGRAPRSPAHRAATIAAVSAAAVLPRRLGCRILALWLDPTARPALLSRLLVAAHARRDGFKR